MFTLVWGEYRRNEAVSRHPVSLVESKGDRVRTINLLVIASFIALNLDVMLQNYRLYKIHESVDISLLGVALRLFAVSVLATKFYLLGEAALFIGQIVLVVNVALYLVLVARYHYKKKRPNQNMKKSKRKSKKY